ncbi:FH protein interacting protein FIP2 [Hibiscus syriacus]|uniref:FH protein interacting protein FIP2 n=1 Tax=Hibiscus syriacus TaxID=106335 RepID=A0A6A3B386_HIBSY|nr:FH protein interacting protein FIP2 [Hibiscus syriacus]
MTRIKIRSMAHACRQNQLTSHSILTVFISSLMMGDSDLSSLIRLSIGGKKFCTTIDTLTQREPDSMLGAMFSGRHALCHDSEKGYIFVDRDGKHFRHILNWLRDGIVPTLTDAEYSELMREAGLIEGISSVLNKRKEDEESHAELTRIDIIKCIQSERVRFRGVNLSGLDLSNFVSTTVYNFSHFHLPMMMMDLSFVDFSFACLKNVFSHVQIFRVQSFGYVYFLSEDVDAEGSIFHNATLREEGVNLQVQIFVGLYLLGQIFRVQIFKANTYNLYVVDACLIDCSFCGADLRSAHLQTADLTDANLEGANLEGANLKGAKLSNANLKGANLQRAYLRHVNLRDTHLEGAKLDGANLLGAIR